LTERVGASSSSFLQSARVKRGTKRFHTHASTPNACVKLGHNKTIKNIDEYDIRSVVCGVSMSMAG